MFQGKHTKLYGRKSIFHIGGCDTETDEIFQFIAIDCDEGRPTFIERTNPAISEYSIERKTNTLPIVLWYNQTHGETIREDDHKKYKKIYHHTT